MEAYAPLKHALRRLAQSMAVGLMLLPATPAQAFFSEIASYLAGYQYGIDYTNSFDSIDASYEIDKPQATPTDNCTTEPNHPTKQICTATMRGGGSSGYGIVITQQFKRQGLFYFRPDIGFGLRYLEGARSAGQIDRDRSVGLPLRQLKFNLGAAVIKPYIQFGITPADTWPDLLISLGPAAQMAFGNVSVNGKKENVAVVTSSNSIITGFVALEIVFWRFGRGALSVFTENEVAGGGRGSKLYPGTVDGMSDFHASFNHSVSGGFYGFGIKVLSPWP